MLDPSHGGGHLSIPSHPGGMVIHGYSSVEDNIKARWLEAVIAESLVAVGSAPKSRLSARLLR